MDAPQSCNENRSIEAKIEVLIICDGMPGPDIDNLPSAMRTSMTCERIPDERLHVCNRLVIT